MASSSISGSGAGKPNLSDENDIKDVEKFQTDMLNLYNSGECSDFTLICEEQEFKVHKAILEARCPSLFKTRPRKSIGGRCWWRSPPAPTPTRDPSSFKYIQYENITPDTLHHMLLYIYGGTTGHQEWSVEQATEIAVAAKKYKLDGLRLKAEKSVCSGMNIDNVLKVLDMTDPTINAIFEDSYLTSVAIKFIAENVQEVMAQPGWEDLDTYQMTAIIEEMTRLGPPQNKKPRF